MSDRDAEAPAPVHRRVLRTVTPPYRSHPDEEMNAVGLAYVLVLLVLLVPLLPFIVIVWAISKVAEAVAGR